MADQGSAHFRERRKFARLRREFVLRVMELPQDAPAPGQPASYLLKKPRLAPDGMTGKNISVGGIAIENDADYVVGSTLALEILLPELEKYVAAPGRRGVSQESGLLRVQCQVMWSKRVNGGKFAVGLRFVNLEERQFKALSRLVGEEARA